VKEFLSREGHAFVERNVDEDEGAYDELVGLGWRAVPVTIVGTRAVRGFDAAALRALLRAS
jgi:hypothetical protein